ncbi:MAG: glycosyltransferase family 2 protein [Pirellulales bacterium]
MSAITTALVITLTVSLAIQAGLTLGYVRKLKRFRSVLPKDTDCQPAVVVLCLRGGDPFLERCVAGLMAQDYPKYEACFIVDSTDDPAMAILKAALAKQSNSNYRIEVLDKPYETCSLKCSSIIQAFRSLPAETHFVAQLDADTIPHPTWLRELAGGLAPDDVGAATGNRWYMPDEPSTASLVRYVWNAAAIVQMYWYRIAWGGTLAVKVSSVREAGLLDRWQLALCEDTMLFQQLKGIKQRVAFVPSLMMVNREDCDLKSFVPWVARQLLTVRLYHPSWLAVVGHGISSAAVLLWGWGWAITASALGRVTDGLVSLAAMTLFQLTLTAIVPWIASAVEHIVRLRSESTQWQKPGFFRLLMIVTATQWIYTRSLLLCMSLRRVDWRGIHYRVDGAWKLHMEAYRPYASRAEQSDKQHSL